MNVCDMQFQDYCLSLGVYLICVSRAILVPPTYNGIYQAFRIVNRDKTSPGQCRGQDQGGLGLEVMKCLELLSHLEFS